MLISLLVVGGAAALGAHLLARSADSDPQADDPDPPSGSPAAESAPDAPPTDTAPAHDIDRGLALTGSALALKAGGVIVAPVLGVAAVVPLTFAVGPFLYASVRALRAGDRKSVTVLEMVSIGGTFLAGYHFACALGGTLVFASLKAMQKTRRAARDDLGRVFGDLPQRAWLVQDGIAVEVDVQRLVEGDRVRVHAGARIPVDGVVVAGVGSVDERTLTGESVPAAKGVGEPVFGSTRLVEGPLDVRVQRTGEETVVGQLHDILRGTDDLTDHYRDRGERIVEGGAGPTLALSGLTLPLLGAGGALAVSYAGFGYQMRLAAPLSALGFVRLAARQGLLVKDVRALELLGDADVVLFDKTGTLTADVPDVVDIVPTADHDPNGILALAAAVEQGQPHPLAAGIRAERAARGVPLPAVERVESAVGLGLRAHIDGRPVVVGSAALLQAAGIDVSGLPPPPPAAATVFVAADGRLMGRIDLVAPPRPGVPEMLDRLRERGLELALVSGDRRAAVERLGQMLGIDRMHAEVAPEEKAAIVRSEQARGRRVCFVGDGVNDAIALKAADVSVSLAGASDVAVDIADIIALDGHPGRLADLCMLADDLHRNMRRGALMTILPGVAVVGGVYLTSMGVAAAIMLYNVSLVAAVANALGPSIEAARTAPESDSPALDDRGDR